MAERDRVVVRCLHPGGMILQLTEVVKDEYGYDSTRRTGPEVDLKFGDNPNVNPDFIQAWQKQYAKSNLVNFVSVREAQAA